VPKKPTKVEERFAPLLPDVERAEFTARTQIWRWKGEGTWYFANLPPKQAAEIKEQFGRTARGWGSIRVRIRIGKTEWNTSLFPHRKSKSYLFAIKADVRKAEELAEGDRITAHITIS
jgi:hypothetical protein